MLEEEGRYVHSEGDANWWIPFGARVSSRRAPTTIRPRNLRTPESTSSCRIAFAIRFIATVSNTESFVDLRRLRPADRSKPATRWAIVVTARNDYRVLQPSLLTDPNRNRTEVAFDTLGMVVGTAVMGKALPAPVKGDSLAGFDADLDRSRRF